jgi:AcrR family transcriptional regulator
MRAAKAAMRREHILTVALGLFAAHGYAGTSTRSIAEAAGVTEGLIFHYFESKDALLFALLARRDTFAGRIATLLQQHQGGTARALFEAIGRGYADVTPAEAAFVGFVSAEAHVNPALRSYIAAGNAVVLDLFVAILTERVRAGELRASASLQAAVMGFFGGFSFFFLQQRDLPPAKWRREAAAFAEAWCAQCWRGIASEISLIEHSANLTQEVTP